MARSPQTRKPAPSQSPEAIPGVPARRAALRLLDAVLRRGEPLDQIAPPILRPIERADDRALALAIVSEALRWLGDIDALIDSATQQNLPEDAKARGVLQIMLAQALRLDLPPHAVIATGLPLLMGGPRRLAHGVFSALLKRGPPCPKRRACPPLPPRAGTKPGRAACPPSPPGSPRPRRST
jgi:16S rRNA (cytosine967-C5)-methyltransferase